VPVLPVASVTRLLPTIQIFGSSTPAIDIPSLKPQQADAMQWATSSAPRKPLTTDEAHTIQQTCGSLEGLERATRTQEGRQRLESHLGANVAKGVFEFWDDEWIA